MINNEVGAVAFTDFVINADSRFGYLALLMADVAPGSRSQQNIADG